MTSLTRVKETWYNMDQIMRKAAKRAAARERIRYRRLVNEHPVYPTWVGLMHRTGCRKNCNPKDTGLYGASRTPLMEPSWKEFARFEEWALANGWASGLQLDRIDGTRGYSADNCRFVSPLQNRRNSSNIFKVKYEGKDLPLTEVVKQAGCQIDYTTVKNRIQRGWLLTDALTRPARKLCRRSI